MNIVILAFNIGKAGKWVNGPGQCLFNFNKILKKEGKHSVSIFTHLPSIFSNPLKEKTLLSAKIKQADLVIHWSGITPDAIFGLKLANRYNKKVYLGPNLIDTVQFPKEKKLLEDIKFDKIITVNERLRYLIAKKHKLPLNKVTKLLIGPDLELWHPSLKDDNTVLWKGNSKQFVKDIQFALDLEKYLNKYKFKFIGYPAPYDYNQHISSAKASRLYITTSLSETMGLCLLESWASGLPSVTHPKIYMHGINYKTGIIANRTKEDYADAITEIMEDHRLWNDLSLGARNYIQTHFSDSTVLKNFNRIMNES